MPEGSRGPKSNPDFRDLFTSCIPFVFPMTIRPLFQNHPGVFNQLESMGFEINAHIERNQTKEENVSGRKCPWHLTALPSLTAASSSN